jgi:proteasome accessory factor B
LVICLLATRQYLPAERIRSVVAGYADAASDEAFFRMFERDKSELRDLGIPLETGRNSAFDGTEGYRIARRDYELADIDLEPDEAAAVALAGRLWESPVLTGAATGALLKLRAAGVDVEESTNPVQPKVRATDTAFAPLLAAVQARQAARFDYRRTGPSSGVHTRTVEPWGVVSWRGRWYVVGHDRDRDAPRCFRLSRVVGEVRTVGKPGEVHRPHDVNLLDYVAGSSDSAAQATTAKLWVAAGRAQGIRRQSRAIEPRELAGRAGDVVEIELWHPESAADWIAGNGPDVAVLEPDTLRKTVTERLLAAVGGAR